MEAKAGIKFKGIWEIKIWDKDRLVSKSTAENLITNEGLNHDLNVIFHGVAQIGTWYCILSETDTLPAAGMTYAVPVFTETIAYNEATRPEYVEAGSTAKEITNAANQAVFTASATKTFYGAALVGGGTSPTVKGDTAGGGTLQSYGKFATAQPVIAGNKVDLTYTITAADAG